MRIALDAMGGDNAPRAVIEGALQSVPELESTIVLVGRRDEINQHLEALGGMGGGTAGGIEIEDTPDVVGMDETISKALRKPHSSIMRGVELVRDGDADAFVSMGHSGAVVAASTIKIKKIAGVNRAALAAMVPTLHDPTVLIDIGASVDSKPANLFQFAVIGQAFARVMLGKDSPSVGLLSNGVEEIKGNEVTKLTHVMLEQSRLNYVGYVEGVNILEGEVDVIVCDGFVGNILLKMAEGFVERLPSFLMRNLIAESTDAQNPSGGGFEALGMLDRLIREKFDYNEHGGAPLLGLAGVCVVGHGRSTSRAVKNAILMAESFVKRGLVPSIKDELATHQAADQ